MGRQEDEHVADIARAHLSAFVPLSIAEIQRQGGPTEDMIERAQERMQAMIRENGAGHAIAFLDKGQTRVEMAILTEVLAVLAFVPGGVKFTGLTFDATNGDTIDPTIHAQPYFLSAKGLDDLLRELDALGLEHDEIDLDAEPLSEEIFAQARDLVERIRIARWEQHDEELAQRLEAEYDELEATTSRRCVTGKVKV